MRTLLFLISVTATPLFAADWPHWRGEHRNDVVEEPSGWDGGSWRIGKAAWTRNVGEGSSSPVVAGDRLYTLGWSDGRDTLYCLDAATGNEIWQHSYKAPRYGRFSTGDKGIYSGISSTPTYDPETKYLYTLSLDGDLNCWDTRNEGRRVWSVNFYDRYKVGQRPAVSDPGKRPKLRDYGYTSSPLVHDDWLVCEVGAREGTVIAFEKRTGRQLWTSECRDEAGHTAGLVPVEVEGVPCAAVLTLRNLLVLRLDKRHAGETVAEYSWITDFANNIPTPAVHGNNVIVTSAYNRYAMCRLRITLDGAKKVWQSDNPSGVCSPVIHEGNVYWGWRGIHCADFETGKERWRGQRGGTAGSCLVTSDDRLIAWIDRGELILCETAVRSASRYKELAHVRGIGKRDAWPHVVLAGGRLYCKDRAGNLVCFEVGS